MTAEDHWTAAAIVRRSIDALEAQALRHEARAYLLAAHERYERGDAQGAGQARGMAHLYAELAESADVRSRRGA